MFEKESPSKNFRTYWEASCIGSLYLLYYFNICYYYTDTDFRLVILAKKDPIENVMFLLD